MDNAEIIERIRIILRRELAECERAIRARDPVRALNDLADAAKSLKALIRSLESGKAGETGNTENPVGDAQTD
jgi:hypothetical protein